MKENKTENVQRTEWEIEKGLVARATLRNQIMGILDGLNDQDFHTIYDLAWTLEAKDFLYRLAKDQVAELKHKEASAEASEVAR